MILKNGRVITQDKDRPYIEDGAVVIEGNKIIAVDTTENILAKYKEEDIIDVDGKVIMPGLSILITIFIVLLLEEWHHQGSQMKTF